MRMLPVLLFLLLPFHGWAQHDALDSLHVELQKMKEDTLKVTQLNKRSAIILKTNPEQSVTYSQSALALSKKLHWQEGMVQSNVGLGNGYAKQAKHPEALACYHQALEATKNKKTLSTIYLGMGQIYLQQSHYSKALDFFHRALRGNESLNNKDGIVKASLFIGSVYAGLNDHQKAMEIYYKALEANKKLGNDEYLATIYRGIAIGHYSLGAHEKSLKIFEKSLAISRKIEDHDFEAKILSDISLVHLDAGDYQDAIRYSQAALKILQTDVHDQLNIGFSYGIIGDSYMEMAKGVKNNSTLLDSAVFYLNKAISLHKGLKSLRSLQDDYYSLTEAQKLQGNYNAALRSFEISALYKDSIYNSQTKETIKNLEDKRTIGLRDNEIKISRIRLDAKEKQSWYFIGGLALLGIIGLLLFSQSRSRRRTGEKLQSLNANLDHKNAELKQANNIKARFFSILNHDLRSPVYNLIHFLTLQKENPELLDDDMKKAIAAKTMSSAENLLQSMEDMLLWSKGQMEHFKPEPENVAVAAVFEAIAQHFASVENVSIDFENPENAVLFTDGNYLKTIMRNLTGNAIRALEKIENPKITWNAFTQNAQVHLSISDNGKGASQEQLKALYDDTEVVGIKTGLGLHLIRDLAAAINCRIAVDSKTGKGTTFTLTFP